MGTQALYGQRFDLISIKAGSAEGALYSVIQGIERIDYIGNLPESAVSDTPHQPTYIVSAVAAAVFEQANIKSPLRESLPRNSAVEGDIDGQFLKLRGRGYIHMHHLRSINEMSSRSYSDVAADMLGLPYIWGGTGGIGVDCSGLVQSALAAIGVDAPRDADQQEDALGNSVSFSDRKTGDLLFWPGHVGIVIEEDQLLHANAHHMMVAVEPVVEAVSRIGAVRTTKRIST